MQKSPAPNIPTLRIHSTGAGTSPPTAPARPATASLLQTTLRHSTELAGAAVPALASPPSPYRLVGDVMDDGPTGLGQLEEMVQQRRRRAERAIFCGGQDFAVLLLKPVPPSWLYQWLSGTVLCTNMTVGALLDRVVPGLCAGTDGDLHAKALMLDAIMAINGVTVVRVWKNMATAVSPYFDVESPAPPRALFDQLCAASPRFLRSPEGRALATAYALDADDVAGAAEAIDIDKRALQMLLDTDTPEGHAERDLGVLQSPSAAAKFGDARRAKRRRYLAAFLRRYAATYTTRDRIGVQRPADGAAPDISFVVLPLPQSGTDSALSKLVMAEVSRRLAYRFAVAEAGFLSHCDWPVDWPREPAAATSSQPKPAWHNDPDALDCWAVSCELFGASQVQGDILRTTRLANFARPILESSAAEATELLDAVHAVGTTLIGAEHDVVATLSALGIDAMLRMHNSQFPVRVPLDTFVGQYAILSGDVGTGTGMAVAEEICEPYSETQALVGDSHVLLSYEVREALDTRLRQRNASNSRLLDTLREQATTESRRLRMAFCEEYAWLASGSAADLRRTPRSSRVGSGRLATPPPRSELGTSEALLMRVLYCPSAVTRRSGAPRWAAIIGVRVMRCVGWADLNALVSCAERIAVRTEEGQARIERLLVLCEIAALCCVAMVALHDKADQLRQCNAVVATVLQHLARLIGPRKAHAMCCEMFANADEVPLPSATHRLRTELCEFSPTLNVSAMLAHVAPIIDVHVANAVAARVAVHTDRAATAAKCLVWLSCDSDLAARYPRVIQVLQAYTSDRQRLLTCLTSSAHSLPLLRTDWIREVANNAVASVLRETDACCAVVLDKLTTPPAASLLAGIVTSEHVAIECARTVPTEVQASLFGSTVRGAP